MSAKRGRPPLPRGEAKDAKLILRMTLAERHAIDEAAQRAGLSASEWARRVLTDAAAPAF